jgi:hypothetical protein
MEKRKVLPTVLGYVLGLAGLFIAVRVASAAWKSGQK